MSNKQKLKVAAPGKIWSYEYMEQRIDVQIKYNHDRSMQYDTYSHRFHPLEWVLLLGGVAASQLEAAHFDKPIPTYCSTANQLGNIKMRRLAGETKSADWVMECEIVLAAENSTWLGLWMKSQ